MAADAGQLALAVDLGGTKILAAVVGRDGGIVAREQAPTLAEQGPEAVIERLSASAVRVAGIAGIEVSQLAGAGLAIAGLINTLRGTVMVSPNLPGWQGTPIVELLAPKLGIAAFLVNDADAAALGEQRHGAGQGCKHAVYVTVSTGIGGGIIVDGKLCTGADGYAGEVGHMALEPDGPKCGCGNNGCLEALASGTAMARDAQTRLEAGEKSLLRELTKGDYSAVTAKLIGDAALRRDPLCLDIIDRAARYLGIGLANLVNLLNPEVIIIGGGVANLGDMLLAPAREEIDRRAFRLPARSVRLVRSRLGAEAGVVGAAEFVFDIAGTARASHGAAAGRSRDVKRSKTPSARASSPSGKNDADKESS